MRFSPAKSLLAPFLKKPRKILKLCAVAFFCLFSCWSLACVAFNYLIIPKIVVPYVKDYCAHNVIAGFKFSVKDIYFHPARGFMLTDFLVVDRSSPEEVIVSAPLVDVDLDWPALCAKKIVIRRLALSQAAITLKRDREGVWNIGASWRPAVTKNTQGGRAFLVVKECSVAGGTLTYIDSYEAGDTLTREFKALNMNMIFADDRYQITVSARAAAREKESLEASIVVHPAGGIEGALEFVTPHLADYWDYYLDRICKPWGLTAKGLRAQTAFRYQGGVAQLENSFTLTDSHAQYGDLSVRSPQALVRQILRFDRGAFDRDYARTRVALSDASVLGGENIIASAVAARLLIKSGTVVFEDAQALWKNQPVLFRGVYTIGETGQLTGQGEIAGLKNQIDIKIAGNHGLVDWKIFTAGKVLDVAMVVDDLKSLAVHVTPKGGLNLEDLARAGRFESLRVSGIVDLSGALSGELDEPSLWQGALDFSLSDVSIYGFPVPSLQIAGVIVDGVFSSRIPETMAYGGIVAGSVKADQERWGFEFDARKISLSALMASRPAYEHLKGTIRSSGAFIGAWGGLADIRGGGAFTATDCNFRQLPFFARAEEGVRGLVKKFVFPDFNEVSVAYDIADRLIKFGGSARASTMKAAARGACDFSGNLTATAGLSLFSTSVIDNARRLLLPYSVGIDLLGSSIQIDVSGKIPDLTRKIKPKTVGWIDDLWSLTKAGGVKKYSLEELWGLGSGA